MGHSFRGSRRSTSLRCDGREISLPGWLVFAPCSRRSEWSVGAELGGRSRTMCSGTTAQLQQQSLRSSACACLLSTPIAGEAYGLMGLCGCGLMIDAASISQRERPFARQQSFPGSMRRRSWWYTRPVVARSTAWVAHVAGADRSTSQPTRTKRACQRVSTRRLTSTATPRARARYSAMVGHCVGARGGARISRNRGRSQAFLQFVRSR
jgi:hypothetical protein